jgi:tetratricopeptide (TPR) repeat protein
MNKTTRVTLLFVAAMIATGCLRRDYIALGEQAMAAEDYRTAEIYFRKAIQREPRSDKAFYDLGTAFLKEQDYNFAYQAFTRAAELNPSNAVARVETGKILLLANQPARAEHEAREALKVEPHLLAASLLLGEALAAQSDTDAARTTLEQAVREQPKSSEPYLALAALESRLQNSTQAIANLDAAIAADPHNPQAYVDKAIYLRSQDQIKQAVIVLRKGLEANPRSNQIKLALADSLLADRQTNEGIALLRSIVATGTDSEKSLAGARLALAEVETNQLAAAETDLKKLEKQGAGTLPQVLYARGRLALAQEKIADARSILTSLTDVAPNFAPGFYYLGVAYAESGDFQKAIDQLHTAAKLSPKVPDTYVLLSSVELKQGNYAAAQADAERALLHDPTNFAAQMLKANALFAQGRNQEAEQLFRKLAAQAPQNSAVHERIAQLALKRKDFATATKEFETALRFDPTSPQLLAELMSVVSQTAGPKAALERVREQVKLQPKVAEFHALLGLLLLRDSQPGPAATELRTAIDENPNAPAPYLILAKAYQMMGKAAQVQAELKSVLVKKPGYTPALLILAAMADQEGRFDEAAGYYQKVLAISPNFGPAANNLATDYLSENKNLDEALDLAQHARQLMPHDPHVADTLGEAMLRRGLPENAVPLLRESVQANPKDPTPHYHLGFALLALKQTGEASQELDTALKLGPNAKEATQARAALAQIAKVGGGGDDK